MDDKFRIGMTWVFTSILCALLISALYWNPHWGLFLIGR